MHDNGQCVTRTMSAAIVAKLNAGLTHARENGLVRQPQRERRPRAASFRELKRSTVQLGDPQRDRQPESAPTCRRVAGTRRTRRVRAKKALEHVGTSLRRNAGAAIRDRELEA